MGAIVFIFFFRAAGEWRFGSKYKTELWKNIYGWRRNYALQHHRENPTGQRPTRGAQEWENAPVPPMTASGWDKRRRVEEEEDKDEGCRKMKDESHSEYPTRSPALRLEYKLICTSVETENDALLMELCVDCVSARVSLLQLSRYNYESNVSTRACPMSQQLKFKPGALQLHWFSVQPASWLSSVSESLTTKSKGTRTSRAAGLEAHTEG